jgi:hypothetical protein
MWLATSVTHLADPTRFPLRKPGPRSSTVRPQWFHRQVHRAPQSNFLFSTVRSIGGPPGSSNTRGRESHILLVPLLFIDNI